MYIKLFIIISLAVLIVGGCTEEDNPVITNDDSIPPHDIVDLIAFNPTSSTVTLIFTASGDDGNIGRGRVYDIRYSTSLITGANFEAASIFDTNLIPNVGTFLDTIVVSNLTPLTKYYFALKIGDEIPNWSGISNIDSSTTLISGSWIVYNRSNSDLPSDTVNDVAAYFSNRYFATNSGLAVYNQIEWMIYDSLYWTILNGIDTTYLLPTSNTNVVEIDPLGSIWVGLQNNGASVLTGPVRAHFDTDNSDLFSNSITEIIADAADNIYLSTANAGFYQYDLTNWHEYNVDSGLAFNFINTLTFDSFDNLWIAYNFGGISKFDGVSFTHFNSAEINSSGVWAIEALTNGDLLLGTDDGLILYNGTSFTNITPENVGFPDNIVTALTSYNNIWWIGTRYGLVRFDGSEWTVFTTLNSQLPNNFINALEVDITGNLIVGTNGGGAVYTQ